MPIPILGVAAAATAIFGAAKMSESSGNNKKARKLQEEAKAMYDAKETALENQKAQTKNKLESLGERKLRSFKDDIGRFLEIYRDFTNVELGSTVVLDAHLLGNLNQPEALQDMEVAAFRATEILQAGAGALGAGALAGIASYGGTMMLASASTGTAISALSGAAATNATLAWLGGGALTSGFGALGVTGGMAVLGGVVLAPVLAVAGLVKCSKSKENLAQARKIYAEAEKAVAEMDLLISKLQSIDNLATIDYTFIDLVAYRFQQLISMMEQVRDSARVVQGASFINKLKTLLGRKFDIDYLKLEENQKQVLHLNCLMAQILFKALSTPLLTEDGAIERNAENTFRELRNSYEQLNGFETRLLH